MKDTDRERWKERERERERESESVSVSVCERLSCDTATTGFRDVKSQLSAAV